MAPRKRGISELEDDDPPKEVGLLERLRNMWEFACVMQFITIFGDVLKIDKEFDINDFEDECLKPEPSDKLEDLGLCLLKWISSHRGLTLEIWDEYARRQYLAKAPEKNPYGDEEEPKKFREFDTFTKIRVLHQLTVWTLWNPDRMREKMPEQTESQQLEWRIEEFGWDRDDRTYYVLDDNRLYRRTDPQIPSDSAWKPKANTLKAQAARRRERKRRRTRASDTPDIELDDESKLDDDVKEEDNSNGYKWECVCVTLVQYREFIEAHRKTRDQNERNLVHAIEDNIMPLLEKAEEAQLRKIQKREKELLNMERMATAKRSSRLADKHEQERIKREQAEADRKHAVELAAARKMEEQQRKMEEERQSRMLTREQRIREREYKRILHEEELAKMEEEAKKIESGEIRDSRHLKANIAQRKKDLEELEDEDEWMFDCAGCGSHGKNFDDGSHSMACEKCNVWQHSKCYGISQEEAESDDFHFICKDCRRREEEANKPKIPPLKFRVGASSSPPAENATIHVVKRPRGRPRKTSGSTTSSPAQARVPDHPQSAHVPIPNTGSSAAPSPGLGSGPISTYPPNGSSAAVPSPYMNGIIQHPYQNKVAPSQLPASPNGFAHYSSLPAPSINHSSRPTPSSPVKQALPQPGLSQLSIDQTSRPPPLSPRQQFVPQPGLSQQHGQESFSSSQPSQPTPTSTHFNPNVMATPGSARTLPSPIQNRPSMSPTQGNVEVGPIAGIPTPKLLTSSISPSPFATPQPHTNAGINGIISRPPSHPEMLSQSPNQNSTSTTTPHIFSHMSGRSPTKHSPPPEQGSRLNNGSSPPNTQPSGRSISGTPIFPPTSMLHPSPEQLDKTPVPTPTKSMTPSRQGSAEMARVVGETEEMIREKIHEQQNGIAPPNDHNIPPSQYLNPTMDGAFGSR